MVADAMTLARGGRSGAVAAGSRGGLAASPRGAADVVGLRRHLVSPAAVARAGAGARAYSVAPANHTESRHPMTSAIYSTEITMVPMIPTSPPNVVSGESLRIGSGRTRRFVGRNHGAGISYFWVDNDPGQGPGLHWHPYPETWVVIEGSAHFTAGGHTFEAGEGDTATVPTGVWHCFKNAGTGRLRMLCIHASDVIVQTWAE